MNNKEKIITNVRGMSMHGEAMWEARFIEDMWYSTAYSYLILQHHDLLSVLKFWLDIMPSIESIETNLGDIIFPQKTIPNAIADLVYKEMIGNDTTSNTLDSDSQLSNWYNNVCNHVYPAKK